MPPQLTVRLYCAAVFVTGVAVAAMAGTSMNLGYVAGHPVTFALLAVGVVLAESLPVKIPRRGQDEEITLSTSFSMALLLVGGLGPALVAQGVASVIQDVASRKPGWRIRFNLGQYTLALAAAYGVLWLLKDTSGIGSTHPFSAVQLPGVLLSAAAFFVVNTGVVGIAVALHQGVPIRRYFHTDLFFVITTAGVLLLLAPIVIATTAYSPVLIPLFAAPILVIHRALWEGARSAHAAHHDPLTGLPNRLAFHNAVASAINDPRSTACVLLMDLDRFKDVNDTLGHHYGDLLLRQVADRLRAQMRSEDQIARLGGDEFAILSQNCTSEGALRVGQRAADSLRAPFELDEIVVDVQASVGIALFPDDGADVETLLQKADVAMYRAKEMRADIAVYEERHDHYSPSKLALSADLRAAIQAEQIEAWYQPELDLTTGQVFAVEALVRWPHAELGLLPPAAFLTMSEHTKLIRPLTQQVLQVALRQLADWDQIGLELAVAVNISTAVLIDEHFPSSIMSALEQVGVSPSRLKLEVTESTLMADPDVARSILHELHCFGVEISIDDFGTGYSSLAYLADLPVSEVKIDRSFVGRMGLGSKDAIIVSSTIDLAHHLGLRAVAEGVEDAPLLSRLRTLGCDAAQGYLISPPLPAADVTRWLSESRDLEQSAPSEKSAA